MIVKIILFPFSFIYLIITSLRNFFYDSGLLKQVQVMPAVLVVGNLRVGGTGKTPHVEYLIQLLKSRFQIATLSRGYGRKSKGFILADETADTLVIGDEPFQMYAKFSPEIPVAVGEDRVLAIPEIMFRHPELNTIILDDAFQHRSLARDLNILLTEYSRPFYKDYILPAGRLRESRRGAKRADVIIVSKCPEALSEKEKKFCIERIREYSSAPVFFTSIIYRQPSPVFDGNFGGKEKVLLFSGLANSDKLEEEVKKKYTLQRHVKFADHHDYSVSDIEKIIQHFTAIEGSDKCILTTEKDMVKLLKPELKDALKDFPVFYLPIEIFFLENKELFDQIVISKIKNKIDQSGETE